jgi:hypothetical protein
MTPTTMVLILGILLIPFGFYRINMSRKPAARQRRHHLIAGIAFVCMGIFLILSSQGVIPTIGR